MLRFEKGKLLKVEREVGDRLLAWAGSWRERNWNKGKEEYHVKHKNFELEDSGAVFKRCQKCRITGSTGDHLDKKVLEAALGQSCLSQLVTHPSVLSYKSHNLHIWG